MQIQITKAMMKATVRAISIPPITMDGGEFTWSSWPLFEDWLKFWWDKYGVEYSEERYNEVLRKLRDPRALEFL